MTLTEPLPAGAVAVMLVDEFTTTLIAGMLPNITVAPDEKDVPVMETVFPPSSVPRFGLIPVTVTSE